MSPRFGRLPGRPTDQNRGRKRTAGPLGHTPRVSAAGQSNARNQHAPGPLLPQPGGRPERSRGPSVSKAVLGRGHAWEVAA